MYYKMALHSIIVGKMKNTKPSMNSFSPAFRHVSFSFFFFRICFRFIRFAVDHTKPKDAQNIVFLRWFSLSGFYIDLLDHSWHFYAQRLSFHLCYLHKRCGNIYSMMHDQCASTRISIKTIQPIAFTPANDLFYVVSTIFICIANYVHSAGDWSFFYKQYHERKTLLSIWIDSVLFLIYLISVCERFLSDLHRLPFASLFSSFVCLLFAFFSFFIYFLCFSRHSSSSARKYLFEFGREMRALLPMQSNKSYHNLFWIRTRICCCTQWLCNGQSLQSEHQSSIIQYAFTQALNAIS